MASLALGIAGAVVGSFFGPLGASVGFAIGSALGGLLDPPKVVGPRLSDLKVQRSEYGRMIPYIYGTMRVAGNSFWQTDLVEHKETSGGKGGPESTTYTYSSSLAIMLCANPILGIERIWADGRLICDDGLPRDDLPFTLYLGSETQLPDPTMEADKGVGNVPAHRGYAYIVFADWFLTEFFNRIPQLEFEIYTSTGGSIPTRVSTWSPPPNIGGDSQGSVGGANIVNDELKIGQYVHTGGGSDSITYTLYTYDIQGNLLSTGAPVILSSLFGANRFSVTQCANDSSIAYGRAAQQGGDNPNASGWYVSGNLSTFPIAPPIGTDSYYSCIIGSAPFYYDNNLFMIGGTSGGGGLWVARYPILSSAPRVPSGTHDAFHTFDAAGVYHVTVDDESNVYVSGPVVGPNSELRRFDIDLNLEETWTSSDTPASWVGAFEFTVYNGYVCYGRIGFCYVYALGHPWTFVGSIAITADTSTPMIYIGEGLVLAQDGVISLLQPPGAVSLASIVEDISLRSGVLANYSGDFSELTDQVYGFAIASQMQCRNALEPLRAAYFFDVIESDAGIKCPKRGALSIVTIDDDDLAAHEQGSNPPPLRDHVRTQEPELPQTVSIEYINDGTDYQVGVQSAVRLVTNSISVTSMQLPIVLTDAEARAIANTTIFSAWFERDRYKFTTSRKWARLEPSDVVTVGGIVLRIVGKTETPSGVITFEAVPNNADLYTQPALGIPAAGFVPTVPPSARPDTNLILMDVPLVADDDSSTGFYAAMAPDATGPWTGANLYKSVDGGATYDLIGSSLTASIIGQASNTLGDYLGGNTFDESNVLTVVLGAGQTLSGVTEQAVLNGDNQAQLGLERFQFRDALLTGTDTYALSGLLRGRRGTENAIPTHQVGENFVLMPVTNIDTPASELFQTRSYKAVTFGKTLASATAVTFANMGAASRPYFPTEVGGWTDASGNLTINWTRRTRIGGGWKDFADVPISEGAEEYVLQVWNAAYTLVARVIEITSPTAIYSAANQVTDFGAVQQVVYISVAQLGAYQLGEQTRATILGTGSTIDAPLAPVPPYNSPVIPPPGGSGGVVNHEILTYPTGLVTTVGVVVGDTYVVKFTSSASPVSTRVTVAEYGDPPTYRKCVVATDVNGNSPVAPVFWGNTASMTFTPSASTAYYVIIKVELPDGTSGRPLGEGADLICATGTA